MAGPGRSSARASRAPRLPPAIAPDEVAAVVEACRRGLPATPGARVACDAGQVTDPGLPTVETIARLALLAHRRRQEFRLERAGPDLLDLLAFCGLTVRVDEGGDRPRAGEPAVDADPPVP